MTTLGVLHALINVRKVQNRHQDSYGLFHTKFRVIIGAVGHIFTAKEDDVMISGWFGGV